MTANSLHPGFILTEIVRHLRNIDEITTILFMKTFGKTLKQGAQTSIHLAVSKEVEGISGLYFSDCKPKEPSKLADDESAKRLWEVSAKLVGLESTI